MSKVQELLKELSGKNNIFFRFQNSNHPVGSHSWGMIYNSEEEAIEAAEEDGLTAEEAVLPGKSCMPTALELMQWAGEFGNPITGNDYGVGYVVIAFKGIDTKVTGHDGEYVAEYLETLNTWSYKEFCTQFQKPEFKWQYKNS